MNDKIANIMIKMSTYKSEHYDLFMVNLSDSDVLEARDFFSGERHRISPINNTINTFHPSWFKLFKDEYDKRIQIKRNDKLNKLGINN